MKPILHHFAFTIKPESLEPVLELFERFGCTLSFRVGKERWCLIEQKPVPVEIQLIETNDQPILLEKKINTHIAFLSDDPKRDLQEAKQWAENKNIKFRQGSWSDKEIWFDLPDIFLNFVIEIIHTSVIEQNKQ